MQIIGRWLIIGGIIWLAIAFNMDTSVKVDGLYGGRVENIGLIAQRQNHLMVAGLATLIGTLLLIFGGQRQVASALEPMAVATASGRTSIEPDLSSDPYRLWLAQRYDIKRNELFDRFVFNSTTYPDLEAALQAAHEVELAQVAAAPPGISAEEQARIDERNATTLAKMKETEQQTIMLGIGMGVLVLVFVVLHFMGVV